MRCNLLQAGFGKVVQSAENADKFETRYSG